MGTEAADRLSLPIGETAVELVADRGAPFYHFALLVPGDRFDAALAWAAGRTELLPDRESGDVRFEFESWAASACYFHDPAGNVVELIAHRGIAESGEEGEFAAAELVGLSELGLVGDPSSLASKLSARLGLRLWDGRVGEPGRLGFVGERARTLILSPPSRAWMPTGKKVEPHRVEALLAGPTEGEMEEGPAYRLRSVALGRGSG